jgi:insulysin
VLISDSLSTTAGASLSVSAGSNQDPHTLQGLAHFCEHMLFLGSKKYPDGEIYFKTITENNGHFNAYTDREITNYFFDIHYYSFETALDLFSRFFIDPIFTKEKVDKEINSVNSEFEKNLIVDSRKRSQILTYITDPDNPFHRFSTGNIQSLTNNSLYYQIELREELLNYHSKYYTADKMKLVVYSNDDLDDLEELVITKFSDVKPSFEYLQSDKVHKKKDKLLQDKEKSKEKEKESENDSNKEKDSDKDKDKEKDNKLKDTTKHKNKHIKGIVNSPYSKDKLGSFIRFNSFTLENQLTISFIEFPSTDHFTTNPFYYFSFLVESRDDDSLIGILKKKQLITKLGVEMNRNLKDWSDFTIVMDLTKDGLARLDDVLQITNAFLNSLSNSMINKKTFDYLHKISKLNFEFGESNLYLYSYISKLAAKLQDHPIQHLLDDIHITHSFNETVLASFASNLKLENSIIAIPAKHTMSQNYTFLLGKEISDYEPWYRTNFTFNKINFDILNKANVTDKFDTPDLIEMKTLDLLLKNTFNCDSTCLDLLRTLKSDEPSLLNKTDTYELWYKKDFTLNFNRTSVELQFDFNKYNKTEDRVNLSLLHNLLKKKLKKIKSRLELFANDIKISKNYYGIRISFTSFQVNILDITKHIVDKILQINQKKHDFDGVLQSVKENLINDINSQPYSVAYDFLKEKLLRDYNSSNKSLIYLNTLNEDKFSNFLKDFFNNYFLRIFIMGDVKEADSYAILNQLKPIIRNPDIKADSHFKFSIVESRRNRRKSLGLQEGNYLIKQVYHQPSNKNNALLKCYAVGKTNYKNQILIKLFHSIIGNIVFRELRINKQFGYIAKSKLETFENYYVKFLFKCLVLLPICAGFFETTSCNG